MSYELILAAFPGDMAKAGEQLARYDASQDELGISEAVAVVKTEEGKDEVTLMGDPKKRGRRIGAVAGAMLGIPAHSHDVSLDYHLHIARTYRYELSLNRRLQRLIGEVEQNQVISTFCCDQPVRQLGEGPNAGFTSKVSQERQRLRVACKPTEVESLPISNVILAQSSHGSKGARTVARQCLESAARGRSLAFLRPERFDPHGRGADQARD